MKIFKKFLFSLVLFYLSNILIWFSFNRAKMIKAYEGLSSSEALKNSGLSNEELYHNMVGNIDSSIFNPWWWYTSSWCICLIKKFISRY